MPRNRVIYQNEALYVGPSPAYSGHYKFVTGALNDAPTQKLSQLDPLVTRTIELGGSLTTITLSQMTAQLEPNVTNLDRIQNISYNFNIPRTDVNQFGNLAAIDRVILDQPTVGLNFNYLQNGFKNEKELGFEVKAIKRPALINLTLATKNADLEISAASLVDGGQGYLTPFVMSFPGIEVANLNIGVATGGLYAGQATGITIANAGELAFKINGVAASAGSYTNININTGITNDSDIVNFKVNSVTKPLDSIVAEGTGIINVSCISGILTKVNDDKNYFIRTVSAGNDVSVATTGTLDQSIIAIGNTVITNYSVNAAVGEFPSASLTCEGRNMSFITGANNFKSTAAGNRYPLPSIDENNNKVNGTFSLPNFNSRDNLTNYVSVFRPGDILLDLSAFSVSGFGIDTTSQATLNAQSFSLSMDLTRENLRRLGTAFAYSKEITFPISYSFSVNVLVSDLKAGNLINIISGTDFKFDANVSYLKPGTKNSPFGAITGSRYTLKNTQLESLDFSSSIGSNKTATLTFGGQMSSPQDSTKGIFMDGDFWMQLGSVINLNKNISEINNEYKFNIPTDAV